MEFLFDVAGKLERHGFNTLVFDTKEDVVRWLETAFTDVKSVGRGSSVTLDTLELDSVLGKQGIKVFNHANATPDTKQDVLRSANNAEVYFLSANAVTADGCILNVDASGNRVSAMTFGPEKVVYIVGRNKIVKNALKAFERLTMVAGPKNAVRVNKKTGCVKNQNVCVDCQTSERICNAYTLLARAPWCIAESLVVLVNEDLGF